MKKKPELFKRTGKSSLALRNFLNNLKENDLHYENKQITQCVFLGVLRLKPVPSIFTSNNVPSVSAPVEDSVPNASKNPVKTNNAKSNVKKHLNKNLPKRDDNKVLSGKVTKRNPEKVKAAVKKVPVKKSNIIKIKLNSKKRLTKDDERSSNSKEESVTPLTSHAFLSAPTLSITPIVSTKFNPVQNLFDKLKQKIDGGSNEAGPSNVRKQVNKPKQTLESTGTTSKVCKINAKKSVQAAPIKKTKVLLKRLGINEYMACPAKNPSPITISDTESTSKRMEDDLTLITDESNSSSSSSSGIETTETADLATDDVIFVNAESKPPKIKARTSPRNRTANSCEIVQNQSKSLSSNSLQNLSEDKSNETGQLNDIIIIPDGPVKEKFPARREHNKSETNEESNSSNEVIVVDEVREIRVSPRLKKMGEIREKEESRMSKQGTRIDAAEVIEIVEETTAPQLINEQNKSGDCSEKKEIMVSVDDLDSKNGSPPKLIDRPGDAVKEEFIDSKDGIEMLHVRDKPKQKKNRLRSPLLPPVLLTPMLLRSELASKKSGSATPRERSRTREKISSRLLRSDMEHSKHSQNQPARPKDPNSPTHNKKNGKTYIHSSTRLLRSELSHQKDITSDHPQPIFPNEDVIFVHDEPRGTICKKIPLERNHDVRVIQSAEEADVYPRYPPTRLLRSVVLNKTSELQEKSSHDEILQSENRILDITGEKSRNDDIVIVKEESTVNENISPRLLRSNVAKQNSLAKNGENLEQSIKTEHQTMPSDKQDIFPESSSRIKPPSKQHPKKLVCQTDEEVIVVKEEPTPCRSLRSDTNKQNQEFSLNKIPTHEKDAVLVISDESASVPKEKVSPRVLRSDVGHPGKSTPSHRTNLDEIVVVSEGESKNSKERSNGGLPRSELTQQKNKGTPVCMPDAEQVIVLIHDEPRTKRKGEVAPQGSFRQQKDTMVVDDLIVEQTATRRVVTPETDDLIVVKHTSCSRLLRSEIVSQSSAGLQSEATARLLRSDTASLRDVSSSPKSQEQTPTKVVAPVEQQTSSPKSRKSGTTPPRKIDEQTDVTSTRLLRSEVVQQTRGVPRNHPDNPEDTDASKNENQTSSRLLRSEMTLENSTHSLEHRHVKEKEKYPRRRGRSLLMDLKAKQKTSMLLRSELAQKKILNLSDYPSETADYSHNKRERGNKEVSFLISSNTSQENIKPPEVTQTPGNSVASEDILPESAATDAEINIITNQVNIPKRKSLIDDLKRKKAAKEKSVAVFPTNQHAIPTSQDAQSPASVNLPITVSQQSNNIIDVPEERDIETNDRAPKDNEEQNVILIPDDIKVEETPTQNISPRRTRNTKICEESEPTEKSSPDNIILASDEVPLNASSATPLEESTSPKRKLRERDNKTNRTPEKSPQSTDLSPAVEESSSAKKKPRQEKDKVETKTVESPSQNDKSISDISTPRKQKGTPSKKRIKDINGTNANKTAKTEPLQNATIVSTDESTLQSNGNTVKQTVSSPRRKLIETERSLTVLASEDLKLATVEESSKQKPGSSKRKAKQAEQRGEDKCLTLDEPNATKSSPKQNKLVSKELKRAVDVETDHPKEVEVEENPSKPTKGKKSKKAKCKEVKGVEDDKISTPPDHINLEGGEVQKPKEKTKSKVSLKVKKKTIKKNDLPRKREATTRRKRVQKTPRATKKKSKIDEQLEANKEGGQDKVVVLSPEAVNSKSKGKKRMPSKRNAKEPKIEENTIVDTSAQVKSADAGTVMPSLSEASKPKQKKKAKRRAKSSKGKKQSKATEEPVNVDIPADDNASKKADITVFDFDETEPEPVPLRLSGTPRKERFVKSTARESEEPKPAGKRPKLAKNIDEQIAKAQAKAKLIAMFGDQNNLEGSANSTQKNAPVDERDCQVLDELSSPVHDTGKTSKAVSSDRANTSPPKRSTSPLRQATITDMFGKVLVKNERPPAADSIFPAAPKDAVFEGNAMPPPKVERRPPAKDGAEEDEYYDDDSDSESRMEWIPEEYAEYKFKYSAKKMMSYKPIHKCKICLLILPTYYKLNKHKKEHAKKENPYNCSQCEQAFPSIDDLTAHLRLHKGKHPYTCKKCDVGFWSKKALDAHTPIHVLKKIKQPNKRFRCDVCAKEFSKLCDVERHTRVHTGEKPCVCNICNKRFQQSHNLSKHLLTHLHVKPYHCEICNKQFGRNDVLNRHLLTHSVDKPIKCAQCQKGFIRQSQLINHMKKNHVVKTEAAAVADGDN